MDDVLNAFEKKNVELKKAENSVPKSLYETLSAFANTDGGIIYLGIWTWILDCSTAEMKVNR